MIDLAVDFHIHGRHSGGTSPQMEIPLISEQAQLKGLDVIASSDALHGRWLKHLRTHLREEEDGLFSIPGQKTRFIIQTEVEDAKRVHHLILLPSIDAAEQLAKKFKRYSKNIDSDGRPNVALLGHELVDHVMDVGGIIGPAHAFTPWTAVYKEYGNLTECYQDNLKHIDFIELGLSAETDMADRIDELRDLTFMTNSDCHSPWPHRLGREFNRVKVKKLGFQEIVKAIKREGGRGFTLNVGLNPVEGKYHVTACTRCYLKFSWVQAQKLKRRCPQCNGLIKKGVGERIEDLADHVEPIHPGHRPPYTHIIPLAEIIALATNTKTVTAKKVQDRWRALVDQFGTEIKILLDEPIENLLRFDPNVGKIIKLFRSDRIRYVSGGGGRYGYPTINGERDLYYTGDQKTLSDY